MSLPCCCSCHFYRNPTPPHLHAVPESLGLVECGLANAAIHDKDDEVWLHSCCYLRNKRILVKCKDNKVACVSNLDSSRGAQWARHDAYYRTMQHASWRCTTTTTTTTERRIRQQTPTRHPDNAHTRLA